MYPEVTSTSPDVWGHEMQVFKKLYCVQWTNSLLTVEWMEQLARAQLTRYSIKWLTWRWQIRCTHYHFLKDTRYHHLKNCIPPSFFLSYRSCILCWIFDRLCQFSSFFSWCLSFHLTVVNFLKLVFRKLRNGNIVHLSTLPCCFLLFVLDFSSVDSDIRSIHWLM